jgi:hypothetical protein
MSILLTLSLLAAMLVPMAAPAAASTGYTALTKPAVDEDGWYKLGTVIMETSSEALEPGMSVVMSLPGGFEFVDDVDDVTVTRDTYDEYTFTGSNGELTVVAPATVGGDDNALSGGDKFEVELLDENQIKIDVTDEYVGGGDAAFLRIELTEVYVDSGHSGDIMLVADTDSTSGFPDGEVVVGAVSDGEATISVTDDETSNDDFEVTIRIKESRAGALSDEDDSIKLSLPDGFEWNGTDGDIDAEDYKTIWGQDLNLTANYDEEELEIGLDAETTEATCFELTLNFSVSDETDAELGDVTVEVGGDSDITPTEIVVGTYGDFGATIEADGDVPEVLAGQADQDAADIIVKETMEGSLIEGRTVLLTLPSSARWCEIDDSDTDEGTKLEFVELTGTNDRTAKFKVTNTSNGEAELTIEDITIDLEANVMGDVVVEVAGSAGLDGELVIAKAVAPVKIEAEGTSKLQIGKGDQPLGDITLTELVAGAIAEETAAGAVAVLKVDLPEGMSFSKTPTVEVTEGDLKIDQYYRMNSAELTKDNQIAMEIDHDSDKPSTIKISNIVVSVDRTVPEGKVTYAVVGSAVNETGGTSDSEWPNARAVATCNTGAVVVTPADDNQMVNSSFVIGATTYTVAGEEKTMDVAPYIKNGRTYLPVRYVAEAVGVTDENIIWDAATQKVTLLKGDKVVQVTIGSTVMTVNGVAIAMDVPAEITSGRTMLPFRFIAQALGATVGWDEATQTVTLN